MLARCLTAALCLALLTGRSGAQTVVASTYWPGDGVVAKNDYSTSSGERYDRNAMTCAAHDDVPLGTRLYLRHGRCAAEITVNDRGPFVRGRSLDCTPAVGKALCLDGLGSVHVDPWPPLPRPRPENTQ